MDGEIIPIDSKTIRDAKSNGVKSSFYMVGAWTRENNMVLGQVKVSEKSNEITAIPKLLELITIKGGTVTTDAWSVNKK